MGFLTRRDQRNVSEIDGSGDPSYIKRRLGFDLKTGSKSITTNPVVVGGVDRVVGQFLGRGRRRAEQHAIRNKINSQRRLTKEHVGRTISRFGEEAGIVVQHEDPDTGRRRKYASAHDIRRGCAQRLINAGVSAETLKVLMRHRSFATTEKSYGAVRAAQSAAAEIYDRLSSIANDGQRISAADDIAHLSTKELKKLRALLNST